MTGIYVLDISTTKQLTTSKRALAKLRLSPNTIKLVFTRLIDSETLERLSSDVPTLVKIDYSILYI